MWSIYGKITFAIYLGEFPQKECISETEKAHFTFKFECEIINVYIFYTSARELQLTLLQISKEIEFLSTEHRSIVKLSGTKPSLEEIGISSMTWQLLRESPRSNIYSALFQVLSVPVMPQIQCHRRY